MQLRLLLILGLLAQQLALPLAISRAQADECDAISCCEVVETATCCGQVVREMRCGKTGGECLCGIRSGDSEPTPEAPRPQEQNDLSLILVAGANGLIESPLPTRTRVVWAPPASHRTHNEIQALLCVWRT
jgi:hypothetical protein